MGYRNYSTAVSHIVDATGQGDFTTITAAIAAATSGQTIFIRPGVYTENITAKAGVNLTSFVGEALTSQVQIKGKISFSSNGFVEFSNLNIITNGDYFLEVTGASTSTVQFVNCTLGCRDFSGVHNTSAGTGSVSFQSCGGGVFSAGSTFFVWTSPGQIAFNDCYLSSVSTGVASTLSAGVFSSFYSVFGFPVTTSGTAAFSSNYSEYITGGLGLTAVTVGGSGSSTSFHDVFAGGVAPALVVNGTLVIAIAVIGSQNAFAADGTGTLNYGALTFTGLAVTLNPTLTLNPLPTLP